MIQRVSKLSAETIDFFFFYFLSCFQVKCDVMQGDAMRCYNRMIDLVPTRSLPMKCQTRVTKVLSQARLFSGSL